jgi:hypothetical protein
MKASSRAAQWWARWKEREDRGEKITAEDYELMKQLEVEDIRELIQIRDEEAAPRQRDLLLELANLQDGPDALARFRKRFPFVAKMQADSTICGPICGISGRGQS